MATFFRAAASARLASSSAEASAPTPIRYASPPKKENDEAEATGGGDASSLADCRRDSRSSRSSSVRKDPPQSAGGSSRRPWRPRTQPTTGAHPPRSRWPCSRARAKRASAASTERADASKRRVPAPAAAGVASGVVICLASAAGVAGGAAGVAAAAAAGGRAAVPGAAAAPGGGGGAARRAVSCERVATTASSSDERPREAHSRAHIEKPAIGGRSAATADAAAVTAESAPSVGVHSALTRRVSASAPARASGGGGAFDGRPSWASRDARRAQPARELRLLGPAEHPDLIAGDRSVDVLEVGARDVLAVVDAAVVGHELLKRHLVHHLLAVRVGVEHDDRERQHVRRVGVRKRRGVDGVERLGERLHHSVDLLRLAGQPERLEEGAQRLVERGAREVEVGDEGGEHLGWAERGWWVSGFGLAEWGMGCRKGRRVGAHRGVEVVSIREEVAHRREVELRRRSDERREGRRLGRRGAAQRLQRGDAEARLLVELGRDARHRPLLFLQRAHLRRRRRRQRRRRVVAAGTGGLRLLRPAPGGGGGGGAGRGGGEESDQGVEGEEVGRVERDGRGGRRRRRRRRRGGAGGRRRRRRRRRCGGGGEGGGELLEEVGAAGVGVEGKVEAEGEGGELRQSSDVLEEQFARGERQRRVPQQCEVDAREEGGELRGAADAEDGDELVRTAEEEG